MEKLKELKKAVVADGHLSEKDVELLRETLFNDEGMTREKENFIFNLKFFLNKYPYYKSSADYDSAQKSGNLSQATLVRSLPPDIPAG